MRRPAIPGTAVTGREAESGTALGVPSGGYQEITADQTGITTTTDITGLAVTFTAGASRRYRVTIQIALVVTAGAPIDIDLQLKESTTVLRSWPFRSTYLEDLSDASAQYSAIIAPAGGAHTYKVTTVPSGGTHRVEASATQPAWILIEDIGAA
jgi:hypothetical protein